MGGTLSVCIEGLSCSDASRYIVGLYAGGCIPSVGDCSYRDVFDEDKIVVRYGGGEIVISEGEIDEGVWINKRVGDKYIHRYLHGGRVRTAYMTSEQIDKYVLAGTVKCLLWRGMELSKAVDEALKILALGGGNPFNYLRRIMVEYECYMRVLNSIDRLYSEKEVIERFMGERGIIIGCKPIQAPNLYIASIHRVGDQYIKSVVKPISVELRSEYRKILGEGEGGFICMDHVFDKEVRDEIESYGFKVRVFDSRNCIIGVDPVKIVILLEKISKI